MQLSAVPHWSHLHQHDCNDRIRSIQVLPNHYFCWLRCSRHSYLFIPTDKMKFSYHEVVVSNSRRLDESGDLNSHDGRWSSSTTRFRHPLAQITSEFRNLIFPDVEKLESPPSSSDSSSEDCCWSRCFLILSTLYWLGLGSGNSSSLEGISENWILYDVESSSPESVAYYRCPRCFSRRCIKDSSLCLCLGPAPGLCYAVGNRPLTGDGKTQARLHGRGTVQTRNKRIIERPNRKE